MELCDRAVFSMSVWARGDPAVLGASQDPPGSPPTSPSWCSVGASSVALARLAIGSAAACLRRVVRAVSANRRGRAPGASRVARGAAPAAHAGSHGPRAALVSGAPTGSGGPARDRRAGRPAGRRGRGCAAAAKGAEVRGVRRDLQEGGSCRRGDRTPGRGDPGASPRGRGGPLGRPGRCPTACYSRSSSPSGATAFRATTSSRATTRGQASRGGRSTCSSHRPPRSVSSPRASGGAATSRSAWLATGALLQVCSRDSGPRVPRLRPPPESLVPRHDGVYDFVELARCVAPLQAGRRDDRPGGHLRPPRDPVSAGHHGNRRSREGLSQRRARSHSRRASASATDIRRTSKIDSRGGAVEATLPRSSAALTPSTHARGPVAGMAGHTRWRRSVPWCFEACSRRVGCVTLQPRGWSSSQQGGSCWSTPGRAPRRTRLTRGCRACR